MDLVRLDSTERGPNRSRARLLPRQEPGVCHPWQTRSMFRIEPRRFFSNPPFMPRGFESTNDPKQKAPEDGGLLFWIGGEGGIRTHVGRLAPNRFRVGAVVTASVPLQYSVLTEKSLGWCGCLPGRGGILAQAGRRP